MEPAVLVAKIVIPISRGAVNGPDPVKDLGALEGVYDLDPEIPGIGHAVVGPHVILMRPGEILGHVEDLGLPGPSGNGNQKYQEEAY